MIITYQDKYQVVPATNILSRKDLFVVNRVDRPDDGYAQDDGYFFQSATSMEGVLWLVDCFFERVFFERVVEGTDNYYQSLANAADLESDYCEFEGLDYNYEKEIEEREETSKTITYTIPARFLPLIFNDDISGLDDDDVKEWEKFVSDEQLSEAQGHWSYDSEDYGEYFSWSNDVTNLGDNVVDIQWVIRK